MKKIVKAVTLFAEDHVATLLDAARCGDLVELSSGEQVQVREDMDIYFKICIRPVRKGEVIRKYGQAIGEATADIAPGEKVHIHNLRSRRAVADN